MLETVYTCIEIDGTIYMTTVNSLVFCSEFWTWYRDDTHEAQSWSHFRQNWPPSLLNLLSTALVDLDWSQITCAHLVVCFCWCVITLAVTSIDALCSLSAVIFGIMMARPPSRARSGSISLSKLAGDGLPVIAWMKFCHRLVSRGWSRSQMIGVVFANYIHFPFKAWIYRQNAAWGRLWAIFDSWFSSPTHSFTQFVTCVSIHKCLAAQGCSYMFPVCFNKFILGLDRFSALGDVSHRLVFYA